MGRFPEAERALFEGLGRDPESACLHRALGALYTEMKRYPEAKDQLSRALELAPRMAAAWSSLGRLYTVADRQTTPRMPTIVLQQR